MRTKLPKHEQASYPQANYIMGLAIRLYGGNEREARQRLYGRLEIPLSGRINQYMSRTETSDLIDQLNTELEA